MKLNINASHAIAACALFACGGVSPSSKGTTGSTGATSTGGSTDGGSTSSTVCDAGYRLEGTTCVDIDECAEANACGAGALCTNSAGSHACACPYGRVEAADGECIIFDVSFEGNTTLLRGNGALLGWGRNEDGILQGASDPLLAPSRLGTENFKDYSSRHNTACGIVSDESLVCWGRNNYGQAGQVDLVDQLTPQPITGGPWARVFTGERNSCAINKAGSLWCWGANHKGSLGQGTSDPDPHPAPVQIGNDTYTEVSIGYQTVCAINSSGALLCWGGEAENVGRPGDVFSPLLVDAGPFRQVGTVDETTCALKTDDTLWCFGQSQGFLLQDSVVPVQTAGAFARMTPNLNCALLMNNKWACVGEHNDWAWPGVSPDADTAILQDISGEWREFRATDNVGCGVRQSDGAVVCFGEREEAQTGSGKAMNVGVPTAANPGVSYSKLSGASVAMCAITASTGEVHCFGSNSTDRFLQGNTHFVDAPRRVSSLDGVTSVGVGSGMLVALTDKTVRAWGRAAHADNGAFIPYTEPTAIAGVTSVEKVLMGTNWFGFLRSGTSTALRLGGTNDRGRLGRNIASNATIYDAASTGTLDTATERWVDVAFPPNSSNLCGIRQNASLQRRLYCWGGNSSNQLGKDDTADVIDDVDGLVNNDTDWESVYPGNLTTCAKKTNGLIYCFGSNFAGMLGRNSSDSGSFATPVAIAGSYDTMAIGSSHACAISATSTHRLYCWGSGSSGIHGLASGAYKIAPTLVADGGVAWKDVAVTNDGACALRADNGEMYCWGSPKYNGLGDAYDEDGHIVSLP